MSLIKLNVKGMTCEHCERAVTEALQGVSGVDRVVEVSREKEAAVVEGEPQAADLVKAIEEEGYEAEVA